MSPCWFRPQQIHFISLTTLQLSSRGSTARAHMVVMASSIRFYISYHQQHYNFNNCLSEEVRHVSPRWLRPGTGAVHVLAAGPVPHQGGGALPALRRAVQALMSRLTLGHLEAISPSVVRAMSLKKTKNIIFIIYSNSCPMCVSACYVLVQLYIYTTIFLHLNVFSIVHVDLPHVKVYCNSMSTKNHKLKSGYTCKILFKNFHLFTQIQSHGQPDIFYATWYQ